MSVEWFIVVIIPLLLVGTMAAVFWLLKSPSDGTRRRRAQMAGLADRLGWRYFGQVPGGAAETLPSCSLLQEHDGTVELCNLMADRTHSPRRLMFHCESRPPRYTPDAGLPTCLHTVIAMRNGAPAVPAFRVYQQDALGGPVGVSGLFRLDAPEDARFRRRFLFAGAPPEQVDALMTERLRRALANWRRRGPKPVVEVGQRWLVVHVETDPSGRNAREAAAALITYAEGVARALQAQAKIIP